MRLKREYKMDGKKAPIHIAVIPDGNRRWAKKKGLKNVEGYKIISYEHVESLVFEAKKAGVKYMSLWIFSTDNWKRSKLEIKFLFDHFLNNVEALLEGSLKNKIRVRHIGRKDRLPEKVVDALEELEKKTKGFEEFNIQLCFDYGGRDEIVRAVNGILSSGKKKINEKDFREFLDTKDVPDPDLIIRTSGEKRTSGLMPFQSSYTELYFEEKHFPDFGPEELRKAIEEFIRRKRNFGR